MVHILIVGLMNIAVILCISKLDANTCRLVDPFVQPFKLTAKYMQFEFKGCEYLAIQMESDLGKVTDCAVQAI